MPVKRLSFLGDSLERLSRLSAQMRGDIGHSLWRVQQGLMPEDYKAMPRVGAGVYEIRVSDAQEIARVFYVAKFIEAVYVLHCFEKKTEWTDQGDIELGQRRYQQLIKERR